ncbi:DNA mismatch repair protein [Vibrio sp. S11_S32]|uniref:DNA mismatch repair protein n=1 Tax=Vibrio sp. S11_S32 TaxID=2720225 RepID=UPI001680E2F4|nr:DNA mismatch repair protein [Vibrio sp. S11_S32]MBD1577911.1 DNA mismatch repair protein [Vibrio sp. S11_S32]
MDSFEDQQLEIISPENRSDCLVSSLLLAKATLFYPAEKITKKMRERLVEVANSGGSNPNMPLTSMDIKILGEQYSIGIHGDFLLLPHREILETIIANAKSISLSDNAKSGMNLRWSHILTTIENAEETKRHNKPFDSVINPNATILSISMYDLAKCLGVATHRRNYEKIEERIFQLSNASLLADRVCEETGNKLERIPIRFIEDFRFCYDPSLNVSGRPSECECNHVFVIPHPELLSAIKSHGYLYRKEQHLMTKYARKPLLKSFLKYIKTNKGSFLHKKKLNWLLKQYIQSFPVAPSNVSRMRISIVDGISENRTSLKEDFGISFTNLKSPDCQVLIDFNIYSESSKV